MKTTLPVLAVGVCALLLPLYMSAATATAAKSNKTTGKHSAMATSWSAETLSGKVTMVDPAQNMLVVVGPNGVPFDLHVSPATRIREGARHIAIKDLNQDINKRVSVKFVPEGRGDIARSITVGG